MFIYHFMKRKKFFGQPNIITHNSGTKLRSICNVRCFLFILMHTTWSIDARLCINLYTTREEVRISFRLLNLWRTLPRVCGRAMAKKLVTNEELTTIRIEGTGHRFAYASSTASAIFGRTEVLDYAEHVPILHRVPRGLAVPPYSCVFSPAADQCIYTGLTGWLVNGLMWLTGRGKKFVPVIGSLVGAIESRAPYAPCAGSYCSLLAADKIVECGLGYDQGKKKSVWRGDSRCFPLLQRHKKNRIVLPTWRRNRCASEKKIGARQGIRMDSLLGYSSETLVYK